MRTSASASAPICAVAAVTMLVATFIDRGVADLADDDDFFAARLPGPGAPVSRPLHRRRCNKRAAPFSAATLLPVKGASRKRAPRRCTISAAARMVSGATVLCAVTTCCAVRPGTELLTVSSSASSSRDENLDDVAELRDLDRRTEKVLFRPRRPVPDEDAGNRCCAASPRRVTPMMPSPMRPTFLFFGRAIFLLRPRREWRKLRSIAPRRNHELRRAAV